MFKFRFRLTTFIHSRFFVLFIFLFLIINGLAGRAIAVDISGDIQTGGGVAGNAGTVDTFIIDAVNDGEGRSAVLSFGAGNAGLTVSSNGLDATLTNDFGQLQTIINTDNTGTATLTLNDATNGDDLRLDITGDILGNVGTDANDLNIIINATFTNDAGDSQLQTNGDITLGSGTVTLNSDADDIAILNFTGAGAQAMSGVINGASAGEGQVINTNTGGTVTFNSAIGSGLAVDRVRLDVNFATTFNGTVSAATDININNTSTATFNGNITTASLNFDQDGTAIIANGVNITGAVNNTTANEGTLTLSGATTISSTVGSTGVGLQQINAGAGAVIFNGLVKTTQLTTNGTSTIAFNAGLTGNLIFANGAGATVTVADGFNLTGTVTNATTNEGTLTLSGTTIVSGAVGSIGAGLAAINAGATGKTASFTSAVQTTLLTTNGTGNIAFNNAFTGNLNFANGAGAIVTVADGFNFTGALTNATTNEGTLTLSGTTVVSGAVGSTGAGLASINAGATGKTVTFTSAVQTTLLTTTGTGNIAFNNAFTGNLNFANGAGAIVTVADGFNFTGALTNATTNEGTLTLSGTTVVSGAVGSTGVGLASINAGATGKTATFTSAVQTTLLTTTGTGNIAFNNAFTGNLNFASGAGATVTLADGFGFTGAITNTTTNQGILNVAGSSTFTGDVGSTGAGLNEVNIQGSGKTATFNGDLKATKTTISNLATLTFTKVATTVTGTITAVGTTGTLDVGTATVSPTGTVTLGANSTLAITIGTTDGQLNASTAGATFASGTTITPTQSGILTAGTIVIVQDDDGNIGLGAGVTTGIVVTDNNSTFNFSIAFNGNNLELTVINAASSAGLSSNSVAINDVTTVAFAGDTALTNALGGLTGNAKDAALQTLAPEVNGGGVAGAFSAGSATSSTVSARTASLRTGISAGQGINAGDEINEEKHFWFQGFGTYADQGTRQGVTGFTSVTGGFAMGADKQVRHDLVVGLASSFAYSDVNASLSQNRTVVNSYQGTMYGTYEFGKYFIDGQVGLAYNDYTGDRFIAVGTVERTAHAGYDGYQVSGKVEVGRKLSLPKEVKFTPVIGLGYTHVGIPEYTETGAASSNLNVKGQDYDILNLSFRGKFRRTYEINEGSLTPQIHLGYNYEAFDNNIQNISSFTGGGNTFQTTGFDPENHTFLGGLGLTFESIDNFDFVATYDVESKTDYSSHSLLLKGRWSF